MYAYKFVQTQLGSFFQESTYRKTIEEYAKQGWRLVQVLPIAYKGQGKPTDYEIIFERLLS
ncbi:DUF4177 domain-containing protein [Lysinibacillus sp. FSL P2-0066]|uniref:DUF4177 domain-containing protein n=1 Tax=Lysinibacillus sp. FSL P2-0066 TaxID=2921720 RepID=UPI0030DCC77C